MTSGKIYVCFEREDRFFRGSLSPVSGAGASKEDSYQLYINNYYYGSLRRIDRGWVFTNQWNWNDLGEVLGRQVEEWERSK
jgi:hypothetical protein